MSYENLKNAVISFDREAAINETKKAVEEKKNIQEVIDKGLTEAMDVMGEKFANEEVFVPQLLLAAQIMQACLEILRPHLGEKKQVSRGIMVIGTVQGDLHDIGKNLVTMMMEGAGFEVIDLGSNVSPENFVKTVKEKEANVLGMSALLSTTMPAMVKTIKKLEEEGIRDKVKVIIGGAPINQEFADKITADCYATDAGSAVAEVKKLLGIA